MPHLLHVWPAVSRRIQEASRTLLTFDFDGTLTPIVDHPDRAALAPEVRDALASLGKQERYLTGIITGRSLADIRVRADVPGLVYAGNHGLEMAGPGLDFVHPGAETLRETQGELYQRLCSNLADLPGVLVEDKGLTLSVHYRMAPEKVTEVEARFNSIVSPFVRPGGLRVTKGKMVLETRPDLSWGKGEAIARLWEVYPDVSLTIFFGDDVTDEDGFAVVQAMGGIAVFVGEGRAPTQALHRLESPQEVAEALRLLEIN